MGCREKRLENGVLVERDCGAAAPAPRHGPGTELKAILKNWFGLEANLGCSCNAMAKKMDARGPDWVLGDGLPQVLSAMRTEHGKRLRAGKTILPWSEFGARLLIKAACRRAREKTTN